MRVIRTAADILGFDSDFLLKHSFQREIYAVPLAHNFKEFLQGKERSLKYSDYPKAGLIAYWKKRWLTPRKENTEIRKNVMSFHAEHFKIE